MEIYRNSAQDIPGAPSTWHICDVSCWRGLAASPFWLRMKTTARKTGLLTQIFYPQIRWKIPLINSWKLCIYIYIMYPSYSSYIHHMLHLIQISLVCPILTLHHLGMVEFPAAGSSWHPQSTRSSCHFFLHQGDENQIQSYLEIVQHSDRDYIILYYIIFILYHIILYYIVNIIILYYYHTITIHIYIYPHWWGVKIP